MRQFACMFILALSTLAFETGPARAQAAPPPGFSTETFSPAELLTGTRLSEAACAALPAAVWVIASGRAECIRYYHSTAGGSGPEALIYFSPDVVSSNGRGEATPKETYLKASPAQQQAVSATWSRNLRLPYILLGRPGTYGSSGEHAKRRTPHEIAVVSSALDAIKARHGYGRLHLIGHTEGGHTAAALLPLRTDIGCVVLASALVSVRAYLAELGTDKDFTGNKKPLDPIASVDRIAKGADLRIFVLTDPDDVIVSARSQTAYANRLIAGGLPARQIFAAASGLSAHALFRQAHQVAAACAKGAEDQEIVATYQDKVPDVPPDAPDPPLHTPRELARGVAPNESRCKSLATALWVHADGRAFACATGFRPPAASGTRPSSSSTAISARTSTASSSSAHILQPPPPEGCSDVPISGRGSLGRHTSRSDGSVPMDRPAIIAIVRARSRRASRRRRSTR
jgi:hypothetical protein